MCGLSDRWPCVGVVRAHDALPHCRRRLQPALFVRKRSATERAAQWAAGDRDVSWCVLPPGRSDQRSVLSRRRRHVRPVIADHRIDCEAAVIRPPDSRWLILRRETDGRTHGRRYVVEQIKWLPGSAVRSHRSRLLEVIPVSAVYH